MTLSPCAAMAVTVCGNGCHRVRQWLSPCAAEPVTVCGNRLAARIIVVVGTSSINVQHIVSPSRFIPPAAEVAGGRHLSIFQPDRLSNRKAGLAVAVARLFPAALVETPPIWTHSRAELRSHPACSSGLAIAPLLAAALPAVLARLKGQPHFLVSATSRPNRGGRHPRKL